MDRVNAWISLIGIGIAIGMAWLAVRLPKPPFLGRGGLGPSFFPLILAVLLFILSCSLLWQALKGREHDQTVFVLSRESTQRVVGTATLFLVYVVLLPWLGYLVATVLFITGIGRHLGRYDWRVLAPVAVVLPVFLWGLFHLWLGVPLPGGLW